ncbi:transposase [Gammaproteobacteria bacterium 42_54_T18]|nr:transposase [Gammaproteobacteria bacterium 42_54_T18]
MPNKRLAMRHTKEILRLKFEAKLSHRKIARSLNIGVGTVSLYSRRATEVGLSWPLSPGMSDNDLEQLLFPAAVVRGRHGRIEPDCALIHQELKRKGVTRQLLWEEYKQAHGNAGYQLSQYCGYYRDWLTKQKRSMRRIHQAGEKLFVDYSGATMPIVNPDTGEIRSAEIFVATLGASNYTFAMASWSQRKADWIDAHVKAFEFFGGVPEIVVPDQLRSAVSKPCRYEPVINASYQHMASHYKTAIIPARPLKPKDKAKAENAVLIVQRWILARLRHQTFFTLADLNITIKILLDDLNQRPFKKLPGSRLSQFELLDKPALRALPDKPYEYIEFKLARINIDYHFEFDKHYYSVPHNLVKSQVEIQATRDGVAVFFKGEQVARHPRSQRLGGFTTDANDMPEAHKRHQAWTPEKLISWAKRIGTSTQELVTALLQKKRHPEQAYRACLGLLNLSKQYTPARLEAACQRALHINEPKLKNVKLILESNMDQLPLPLAQQKNNTETHHNVRGSDYYH